MFRKNVELTSITEYKNSIPANQPLSNEAIWRERKYPL